MPECEMCGSQATSLIRSKIEGSELSVCPGCARFGTKVQKKNAPRKFVPRSIAPRSQNKKDQFVSEFELVSNYSSLIQKTRSKLGKTQKEFAAMLNEKESLIHHMENSEFEPSIDLAKKIEKILSIKLLVKKKEGDSDDLLDFVANSSKNKSGAMTLGDMIKVRKK